MPSFPESGGDFLGEFSGSGTGVGRKRDGEWGCGSGTEVGRRAGAPEGGGSARRQRPEPWRVQSPGWAPPRLRNLRKNCIPWALTGGDVLAGQEARECGDLFGPPWRMAEKTWAEYTWHALDMPKKKPIYAQCWHVGFETRPAELLSKALSPDSALRVSLGPLVRET